MIFERGALSASTFVIAAVLGVTAAHAQSSTSVFSRGTFVQANGHVESGVFDMQANGDGSTSGTLSMPDKVATVTATGKALSIKTDTGVLRTTSTPSHQEFLVSSQATLSDTFSATGTSATDNKVVFHQKVKFTPGFGGGASFSNDNSNYTVHATNDVKVVSDNIFGNKEFVDDFNIENGESTRSGISLPTDLDFSVVIDLNTSTAVTITLSSDIDINIDGFDDGTFMQLFGNIGLDFSDPNLPPATVTDLNGNAVFGVKVTSASGNFSVSTPAAAVPEPASWALMLGGFGLVGGAMRRKRISTVIFS